MGAKRQQDLDLVRALSAGLAATAGLALALACGSTETALDSTDLAGASADGSNRPPRIARVELEPSEPRPGEQVTAHVEVQDPEGDEITLGFTWSVGGDRLSGGTASILIPGRATKGQRVDVAVTASDGAALSEAVRERGTVGNSTPEWISLGLEPGDEVPAGTPVVAVPEARDRDGDALEYRYIWYVNGSRVDARGSSLATKGLRRGDEISLTAELSDGEDSASRFDSAVVRVANADPKIVSAPGSLSSDGVFRYTLEVRDPDGDRSLRFRLVTGPERMQIDPILGEIVWRPDATQIGKHEVVVAAADSHGGEGQQRFELDVRAPSE